MSTVLRAFLLGLLLMFTVVGAAAQEATPEAASEVETDVMLVEIPGLTPEGIEYDAEGERFLIGSLTQGTIHQINADGTVEPFIEDEDLISSIGLHIDQENKRLLVANSDAAIFSGGGEGMAGVAAYDLESGERLFIVDLSDLVDAPNFANDLTSDPDGNVYVTDTMGGAIYVVDMEGNASVFLQDARFNGGFLNGIEYHAHEFLLVALAGTSELYKVPLDDPASAAPVAMDAPLSIDGMIINPENGNIIAVGVQPANGTQVIARIVSDDDYETATIAGTVAADGNATTVTLKEDWAYYVKAYFDNPAQEVYDITGIPLEALADVE